MTWRRLGVLIAQLPRHSATARAKAGPDAYWSDADYLLAMAVDALHMANWQRANAGAKHPSPQPKPVTRPKQAVEQQLAITRAEDTRRRLLEFRERRARELASGV